MNDSEIKNFFEDQTVFITGGTGFLGKVIIEKLLRTCDVRKIYILIRSKKGKTIQERVDTFYSYPCFDRLKKEKPNFENLVVFLDGNCEKINLGINSELEQELIDETNVIIHAAANVKFDQPLREAANINIRSTKDILKMAKKMPFLKALVYVSTVYSNCPHRHIGEEFYDPPINAKKLMAILDEIDDQLLNRITPKFIAPWPNTYTFTKSIAEDLIRTEASNLPVAIVRPAIVTGTSKEPVPGWVDNFYGVIGIGLAAGLGVIRSFNAKLDNICTIVPCDYVANIVLVSAWDVAKDKQNIPIYNYLGSKKNLLTWRQFMQTSEDAGWDYPSVKMVWYYTFKLRENPVHHKICVFFQHTVVAYIVDFVLICFRRQPIAVKNYKRLDKLLTLTSYFPMNNWTFDDRNVEQLWGKMSQSDKKWFNFNTEHLEWKSYAKRAIAGGRIYLLKDPLDTIPQGKNKLRILMVAHYSLVTVFYVLLFFSFWWIVKQIYDVII